MLAHQSPGPASPRRAVWIGSALLALAFVVLYVRAIGYPYVWDDRAIYDSPAYHVGVLEGLTATQHDHLGVDLDQTRMTAAHDSYRPLMYLSYRADVALFGMKPGPMHAHNLVIALCVIGLAGWTARRWFLPPAWALVAAAIYGLHPLQVEAVTYVSGRGDLLAAAFALASVLGALSAVDREPGTGASRGYVALSALCFLASLLSKEAYLALPIVVALVLWSRGGVGRRATWPVLALLGVLCGYLVLRLRMAGSGTGVSPVAGVIALPGIVLDYLWRAACPVDLSTERLYDRSWTPVGWGVLLVATGTGLHSLRWPERLATERLLVRRLVAAYAWVLLLVGPSALIVLLHGVSADRYMYLPLFGFATGALGFVRWVWDTHPAIRRVVVAAGAIWSALCALIAYLQVPIWRSDLALYTHATAHSPDASMAHYRLGYVYAREHHCDLATPRFERALVLDPNNIRARNNLGVCFLGRGQPAAAAHEFSRVVAANPSHYRAWLNLGLAQLALGNQSGACGSFERAIWINPQYTKAKEAAAHYCRGVAQPTAP